MGQIGKGLAYVKSIPCILKIIEIVVLLIAFSLPGHFLNETSSSFFDHFEKKGNINFFLFATVSGWIICMAFMALFIIGLHQQLSEAPWTLIVAVVSVVWTVLLLISSALLAAAAKHYDDETIGGKTVCEWLDNDKNDSNCGQLIGGTILGFMATLLFAVDVVIHARMFLTKGSAPEASAAVQA